MNRQAGIYLRISSDPNATRLGVTRQRKDCEAKAKDRGWHVVEVFEDNDVSASTGKQRPAYERMLEAIRAGRINAVVVWDLDRLTRRPIEIEQFIELADTHKVELASVGGDVDLSTDNGRLYARIKGAVARAEVERKTERQKAANAQRREQGRPHVGRRGFGYTTDKTSVIPEEAEAIQRAAAALLSGASMYEIARSLNDQGLLTTAGNPWKPTEVRRLLARPTLAGMVTHRGEIVGQGSWPAIIDLDTHRAIRGVLADPARHKAGRPRAYLLSGIATCGVCGEQLFGGWDKRKGYGIYRCPTRKHISRRVDDIDGLAAAVICKRLKEPDSVALLAKPNRVEDSAKLQLDERAIRTRLNGLAEAYASGEVDREQLAAGTTRLKAQLTEISQKLNEQLRQPDLSDLLVSDDIVRTWDGLQLSRQREVIRLLLRGVQVMSAGQGARVFDPGTVRFEWVNS